MELILSFLFLIVLKSYSSNKSDDIHTFLKENYLSKILNKINIFFIINKKFSLNLKKISNISLNIYNNIILIHLGINPDSNVKIVGAEIGPKTSSMVLLSFLVNLCES